MPSRIKADNGAPFAGTGLLGLSKLSLGWMKMGIFRVISSAIFALVSDETDSSSITPRMNSQVALRTMLRL